MVLLVFHWRIKQQGPPHPRLEHPGTRGGQTPGTGSNKGDQAEEKQWSSEEEEPEEMQ